ncbi:T-complex testis-specific protein 3 [Intoshia linei]|uniref:T-complex testis-specific protein 3 n=1 Tax=Intoshia linei TaxID=1819745 RepID=A0A177B018_9BILA|nr:T-complex testis-specific protein 3 [Intoshia linei]
MTVKGNAKARAYQNLKGNVVMSNKKEKSAKKDQNGIITNCTHFDDPKSNVMKNSVVNNTYRLEPMKKFPIQDIYTQLLNLMKIKLSNCIYKPVVIAKLSKTIADKAKEISKKIMIHRYKIITFCTIGEKLQQQMDISTRCLLNDLYDNMMTITIERKNFFATLNVYAFYCE